MLPITIGSIFVCREEPAGPRLDIPGQRQRAHGRINEVQMPSTLASDKGAFPPISFWPAPLT